MVRLLEGSLMACGRGQRLLYSLDQSFLFVLFSGLVLVKEAAEKLKMRMLNTQWGGCLLPAPSTRCSCP